MEADFKRNLDLDWVKIKGEVSAVRYLKRNKTHFFLVLFVTGLFFTRDIYAAHRCKIANLAEFIKTLGEFQKIKGYPKTTRTLSFFESPQQLFERIYETLEFIPSSRTENLRTISAQEQNLITKTQETLALLRANPGDLKTQNKLHSQLIQLLTDLKMNFEFVKEGKNSYIVLLPDTVTPVGKFFGTILEVSPTFSVRINLNNLDSLDLSPGPHNTPTFYQMRNLAEIPLSSLITPIPNSEQRNARYTLAPVIGSSFALFAVRSLIIHNTRLNKKPYLNALRTFKNSKGQTVQVPLSQTFAVPFLGRSFLKEPLNILKSYVTIANSQSTHSFAHKDSLLSFVKQYQTALNTHRSWIQTQLEYLEPSLDNVSTYINEFEIIKSSYDDPFKDRNHWGFSRVYKDSEQKVFDRNILTLVDSQSFTASSPGEDNKIYALFNINKTVFGLGHIEAKGEGFEYLDIVVRHNNNSELSYSLTAPHLLSLVKKYSLTDYFLPEDKEAVYLMYQALSKQLGAIMQHLMFEQKMYQNVFKSLNTMDFYFQKLLSSDAAKLSDDEIIEYTKELVSESLKIDQQYQSMIKLLF